MRSVAVDDTVFLLAGTTGLNFPGREEYSGISAWQTVNSQIPFSI
ncbi:MAG: hypothetical protein ACK526_13820 [Planctomyces sp.]|jgi:hypothetical protein